MKIIRDDFLLADENSRRLYEDYAACMPVFDFHSHLPAREIAENRRFENLTQIWLGGDHYKWRLMRARGIPEKLITGPAGDEEKFLAWAETMPYCLGNPVYHWSYLELSRYFDLHETLLNRRSAKAIYEQANYLLQKDEYRVQNLLRRMNVRVVFTTDDPTDDLYYHRQIAASDLAIKVLPTFRPDRALMVEDTTNFHPWIARLEKAVQREIRSFEDFLVALDQRHQCFHEAGGRASDHGLNYLYAHDFTKAAVSLIFAKARKGERVSLDEAAQFKSAVMRELARMNARRGWVQQIHLGAMRGVNRRMTNLLGPDTGYDAIGDYPQAIHLARFLDHLDQANELAKTILFNINPGDNEILAALAGCFTAEGIKGKVQFGPAWWFLDHKEGMERQLSTLAHLGLLSSFIGMVTDSRSFLSYVRHEYFRRILCNLLGTGVARGEIFEDSSVLGEIIRQLCYQNAALFFDVVLPESNR
jgi:glucuronate isomerase